MGGKLHVDQPAGFVHTLINGIAQNLLLISLPSPSSDTLLVFHAHPLSLAVSYGVSRCTTSRYRSKRHEVRNFILLYGTTQTVMNYSTGEGDISLVCVCVDVVALCGDEYLDRL